MKDSWHLHEAVIGNARVWLKLQASCPSTESAGLFESRFSGADYIPADGRRLVTPFRLSNRSHHIANWSSIVESLPDGWDDEEFRIVETAYPWCDTLADGCDCHGTKGRLKSRALFRFRRGRGEGEAVAQDPERQVRALHSRDGGADHATGRRACEKSGAGERSPRRSGVRLRRGQLHEGEPSRIRPGHWIRRYDGSMDSSPRACTARSTDATTPTAESRHARPSRTFEPPWRRSRLGPPLRIARWRCRAWTTSPLTGFA